MVSNVLDDRYDWTEIRTWDGALVRRVRAECRHAEVVDVHDVTGELVAHLCLVCDQQLP